MNIKARRTIDVEAEQRARGLTPGRSRVLLSLRRLTNQLQRPPTLREMADDLDIAPTTVMEHLSILLDMGIVQKTDRRYQPCDHCPTCAQPLPELPAEGGHS